MGKTSELTFQLKNYNQSDKIEVAAVDSNGNLISKADNFTLPKEQSNTKTNNDASSITYNFSDSHNKTYTDSPIVTNSPNYTGTVSGNSTVINMGSIYNASGKAKVTNNIDVDGKKYSQELENDDDSDDA